MYVIELALKMSPFPLSVQRKELRDAQSLYNQVRECLLKGQQRMLELNCEQLPEKKIAVLASEVLGVQMYEKTPGLAGNRRPGFSL